VYEEWLVTCHNFVPVVDSVLTFPTFTFVMERPPTAVISILKDLMNEKLVPVAVGVGIGVVPDCVSSRLNLTEETAVTVGPEPVNKSICTVIAIAIYLRPST
jgi:hypothetical protein